MNPCKLVYNVKCEADLAPLLAAQHSVSHVEVLDDVSVGLLPVDLHLQPPRLAPEGGFVRGVASRCNTQTVHHDRRFYRPWGGETTGNLL